MSKIVYVIKTLPRGVKPTGPVELKDLTEVFMSTNSAGIAKSSVDGNKNPMAAFFEGGNINNLARFNKQFMKNFPRNVTTIKVQAKAPPKSAKAGKPQKGRFDNIKPRREEAVREVIVERV